MRLLGRGSNAQFSATPGLATFRPPSPIRALVNLTPVPVSAGQMASEALPAGALLAQSYQSLAGAIVSQVVAYRDQNGPLAANAVLSEGQTVTFEVTVTDAAANTRTFRRSTIVSIAPGPGLVVIGGIESFTVIGTSGVQPTPVTGGDLSFTFGA